MQAFKHHVLAGCGIDGDVFVTIKWTGERLSITGVAGPKSNGDCRGSCGQITGALGDPSFKPAVGIDVPMLAQVWKRWHLNDMRAGSPAQSAHIRAHPVTYTYPDNHYEATKRSLVAAGLQPDAGHMLNGLPYSYGSSWLYEEVPESVLEFLFHLPQTDQLPALWAR